MSEKIKERHNKMTHDMYEEKEHYKMYKSGNRWVSAKIATIAGIALFSTAILGTGNQVNADTVNSVTSSTQVASSASKGMNVDVPHKDLDNAVKNAQNVSVTTVSGTAVKQSDGTYKYQTNAKTQSAINVKQDATQNKTANAGKPAEDAENQIKSDYQQQADSINKTTDQVKQNVADYQNKVDQVNKMNQEAVDTYNAAKQAVDKNNSVLNSDADAAKKNGVNVTTNNEKTVATTDQANSDFNNNDQAIKKANSQQDTYNANYQAALNKYNDDQNAVKQATQSLTDKINAAKKVGVNVVIDNNQDAKNVDDLQSDYANQEKNIQNAIDIQNKYNEAVQGLSDKGVAVDGIDPTTIQQQLVIGRSPNAKMSYKILNGSQIASANIYPTAKVPVDTKDNSLLNGKGWIQPSGDSSNELLIIANSKKGISGPFAEVTYTDTNITYKGQPVSKVVATFSDLQPGTGFTRLDSCYGKDPDGNPFLRIFSDPSDTFWDNNADGITVEYQFYDKDGNLINMNNDTAYLTAGSLNNTNHPDKNIKHIESATLDSNGTASAIKGSSVTVHNGKTLYSDNNNTTGKDGWDQAGSIAAYYGAGIFDCTGNSVKITFATEAQNDGNPTSWDVISTTIPTIPTKPSGVYHVHYDNFNEDKPQLQHASVAYNTDELAPLSINNLPTYTSTNINYHYDGLTITPVETKNVTADNQNINGKQVVKDENVSFPLSSAPLPANRTDDVKTLSFTDTLDKNVKFDSWKAVDATGNDVSKDFTMSQSGQNVTFTATQDFMNQINSNKSSQFDLPTINIAATATASGVQIDNTFEIHVNGNTWSSNKVEIYTPDSPKPAKNVDDNQGNNINDNFVEPGQDVDFNLTFDLSKDKNVVLSKDAIAKGLDMSDTIDNRLDVNTNGIKITDEKGKELNKDLFNITNKDNTVTVTVKDPQTFLNNYGEQKLNIFIPTKTKQAVSGIISNTAIENHFGDKQNTNQVVVYIPAPHKDVAAGTIQGTSSVSIDGKNVVQGQDITFTLTTTDLPAGRQENVNSYQAVDKLDPNFDYTGFRAFLGNTDVTDQFTPTLTKDANGQWTVTFTASSALVAAMNKDKNKAFTVPTIDIYGKAIKGGLTIKNSYVEKINNANWTSNTVSVNTEKPGTPVKVVDNADGQDANNGNVARGDALIYHVSMDLTNQSKDTVLTPDTIAKGLWITDKMPNGVTVNTADIRVNSADGKDITSQFTIADEDDQIKVTAKDPAAIIKEYGGTKLDITIPTTVNDGFTGDITNTATQNTFGNIMESNTVVNHVPPMNPTKDVVVDLGNQNSLNGKEIALNSTFEYKLNLSTRAVNYTGKTTEWGMQDHLDTKHDEFTGQWQVIADHPFVLKDGTTIKAGSDISKYFTMTYDTKKGEFDVEANKDFLDIMNLPANKKTEQGWSVFLQCKRIASGTAFNMFSETYNGRVENSNTVKTTTPEPKKPETSKTPETSAKTPAPVKVSPVQPTKPASAVAEVQPKATPAAPVLAAPAPVKGTSAPAEKQAMPQTGEEENNEAALVGLAALGMVGMMGLGLRKKRYED